MPLKNKNKASKKQFLNSYLHSKTFHRVLIGVLTIILAYIIIENGAAPKKYKLTLGESSRYDITAPRDIENKYKEIELAQAASDAVPPVMIRLDNIPIDTLNLVYEYFTIIEEARKSVERSLQDQGITKKDKNYAKKLETEQAIAVEKLEVDLSRFKIPLSNEQYKYIIVKLRDAELSTFKKLTQDSIGRIMKDEINNSNLIQKVNEVQNTFQESEINQEMKNIGALLVKAILRPNSIEDTVLTENKKNEAYKSALEAKQIISMGTRIISVGDTVTKDKLEILDELKLLESGKFDFSFAIGIFVIVILLAFLLILYMSFFCKKILLDRSDLILLCIIMLLTLVIARFINIYSPLMVPIFMAPMLISILLDLRLAIAVNMALSISIFMITKGDVSLLYVAIIGGTFAAFIVSKANQRSKLSASGLLVAVLNAFVILGVGLLYKNTPSNIANGCGLVALNGVISTILTIGILPFFEITFNIITPLKLLELANPNQPLFKRLLMEAPGTYHHSLMVGNLAEVATEAINGNALLARVGAYYHDVGKLKRPNFFKENQLSDNPHDRMTANLSTLVITSHTSDGAEIAENYKLPFAIKEIINQHHGTTLAAYFYYKAKKGEKGESVKQEDYRYQGPRPTSKEAAVVMLADSVEAAVRSMLDKTEGKIEGLIRKIIKDKLDDGQLDLCDLTLKDLDIIARSFLRVFGGYFHEREKYPEVKIKKMPVEDPINPEHEEEAELPKQEQADSDEIQEKELYEDF